MSKNNNRLVIPSLMMLACIQLALLPATVRASFCMPHGDSLQDGDVVFSGKVLSITHKQVNSNFVVDVVLFSVMHIWRGTSQSRLVVYAGAESGRDCGRGYCGYTFEVGKSYLVFAYSQSAQLTTNGCCSSTPPPGFT